MLIHVLLLPFSSFCRFIDKALCIVPHRYYPYENCKCFKSPLAFSTHSHHTTCSGLISHILGHMRCLICMGYEFICDLITAYLPFNSDSSLLEEEKIIWILRLKHKYDTDIITSVSLNVSLIPKAAQLVNSRHEKKMTKRMNRLRMIKSGWELCKANYVQFQITCLHHDYYEAWGTKWSNPPVHVLFVPNIVLML